MNVFATDHPLSPKPMRPRTKIIVLAVFMGLVVTVGLFIRHIDGPRVVVRAIASDGTEFCIVQKCNWDLEFFTTSCYYRKPGGRWGWFYYDHEDWYWRRGQAEVDEEMKRISIFRDGRATVTFDWESEVFHLLRMHRTIKGAQGWMPSGWSVTQE